jgi:GNAT superfamily N-acetyltransferase
MAFIVTDYWQGLGLGTKMVDYTLDIAKEKGVEKVYAVILSDNYRALTLTKKMGFNLEYLSDGTVKSTLDLKNEDSDNRCTPKDSTIVVLDEQVIAAPEQKNEVQEKQKVTSS